MVFLNIYNCADNAPLNPFTYILDNRMTDDVLTVSAPLAKECFGSGDLQMVELQ